MNGPKYRKDGAPVNLKKIVIFFLLLCLLPLHAFADITVPQIKAIAPAEVPDNEAMRFLKDMGVGWNLGNTFDAYNDSPWMKNEMEIEKYWCQVYTTEQMIKDIHDAGFSTIRIPVSWHNHVSGDDFVISEKWLERVQTVVDWAYNLGMYVILNTHHDCYPEFYYPLEKYTETSDKYIASIFSQLAERFSEYDQHLIFESMNEPRLKDTEHEWWFDSASAECQEALRCINRLNQVFVDTVRAAGGKNADRYLMVPSYDANPDYTALEGFELPKDTADNKIIVSAHAYTPYSFALQAEGGTASFDLNKATQTSEINRFMMGLYRRYIANGIPAVIGEFGARSKDNLQDRVNFTAYYVAAAQARNLPCCWWDNNAFRGSGELFGIYDRKTNTWPNPEILEAIMTNVLDREAE